MRDLLIGICPCKDCENRHLRCHTECQQYIDWDKVNSKLREQESQLRAERYKPHKIGSKLKNIRKRYNQYDYD